MSSEELSRKLEEELNQRYGPVLSSKDLMEIFQYRNVVTFRNALSRGHVPVPMSKIPNRRGRFALSRDVVVFLIQQREKAAKTKTS